MSVRTSSRVRNPSTKLIEATAPDPTPSETSSVHISKRRKVDTKSNGGKKKNGRVSKVMVRQKNKDNEAEEGEEEGEEEEEDLDRVYCVCREKYSAGVKMIQCDHCLDWFHFKCIKMTQSQASQIHSYICSKCKEESGGELKSIRTSDITLLPSPPGSTSSLPPKTKTKRGKATSSTARTSSRKSKLKSENNDNGDVKEMKVEDAPSGEDEDSSSSSSSSSDDSSGESMGSGDEAWVTKKKKVKKDGSGHRAKRGHAESDNENSETDSEGVAETPLDGSSSRSRSYSVDPAVKRGARPTKRKASGTATQSAKRRRSSGAAGAAVEQKSGVEADKNFPMRKYCVNKLIPVLEGIFLQYYREAADAASRPQEQDDGGKLDIDGEAVLALADETPIKLLSEVEVKRACHQYAEEVELALFNQYKEYSIDKKMMVPGARYKAQFSLVHSSLDKNLRPDLRRGIATSTIPPSRLAIMDSNDLATEDQLKERRRLQAESMKSLVRSDDSYSQIKYTKKGLEDSELLQRIQSNISRRIDHEPQTPKTDREREDVDERMASEHRPRRSSVAAAGDPSTPSRETPPTDESKSPVRGATTATATPEAGPSRPPPRLSSFSLSAVLGTSTATQQMDYGDDSIDDDVLPGFADTNSGGFDEDAIYLASERGTTPVEDQWEPPAKVVTPDDEFRKLPVVWTGHILNPADPENSPPLVEGRQIGGRDLTLLPHMWPLLIPHDPIHLVGRVPTNDSARYLLNCRLSPAKELIIVAFIPKNDEERKRFDALKDFHVSRGRHGVSTPYAAPPPGAPKEVYIVPLTPGENFEFLDLMDRYILPEGHTMDLLLGVFIIPKSREEVMTMAMAAPPPPVVSAQAPAPVAIPGMAGNDLSSLLASLKPEAIQSMLAASKSQHPSMPPFPPSMPPYGGQSLNPTSHAIIGLGHVMPPPPLIPSADGNSMLVSTPHGMTPPASASPPVHPSRMRLMERGQERGQGQGQQGHDHRYHQGAEPGRQRGRWDRWE